MTSKKISAELDLGAKDQFELEALEFLLALPRRSRRRVIAAARLFDEIQFLAVWEAHITKTKQTG